VQKILYISRHTVNKCIHVIFPLSFSFTFLEEKKKLTFSYILKMSTLFSLFLNMYYSSPLKKNVLFLLKKYLLFLVFLIIVVIREDKTDQSSPRRKYLV